MKSTLLFLFFTAYMGSLLTAQIIPTEIQYNPPEFGQDSLEYLELYNASGEAIEMEGYSFSEGLTLTFEAFTFPAESYIVLVGNTAAFSNQFGFEPDVEWEARALSNSGEVVEMQDDLGNTVFSIEFGDRDPWPSEPDGNGPSLELCDLDDDYTLASSWGIGTQATGVVVDGIEILGTPGAANVPDCGERYDHRIEVTNNVFSPADITITEGEVVLWENLEGSHNVDGRLSSYPDNPEGFYSGPEESAPWTFSFTFNQVGVYSYECNPHAALGMVGTITVEPEEMDPEDYPPYNIGEVTTNTIEEVADSIGVQCSLHGIIHGANRRENGYIFTLIDSLGDGIGVFRPSDIGGYRPQSGDELTVEGTIAQFNGLTQINAENIIFSSEGNELFDPILLDGDMEEFYESQYLMTVPVNFVDPDQWDDSGSSFNFDVETLDGIVYDVRIDANTELAGLSEPPLPNGFDDTFILTAVGGQFDSSLPYDSGYQLLPSFTTDFDAVTSTDFNWDPEVEVFPVPTAHQLTVRNIPTSTQSLSLSNAFGQRVYLKDSPNQKDLIDVGQFSPGLYFLTLHSQKGVFTQRVYIQSQY